ncbi:MAG TPA: tRNA (adenosine(37)-N6)-threonylcarbamoyltransferase complex dimerization subunit type 1 TsaB [Erysipelotrichaceae bacterium]|nr:tRNA (adenosine(37)-N6)-threonylcarbamoyltransferase complex dimerization subunit type 1 TsaB [Erysipelotrichaceae bacterium]
MIAVLLDSSNINLSVGIAKDNLLLDYISYESWQRQSENMIPELEKILKRNHVSKEDISEVIVAIGPGSYTGVRIAITIAKTMAVALNIKVYGVSSLRVQKDGDKPTISLINARGNRSYFGVYKGSDILVEDCIMKNEEVLSYIASHPSYSVSGDVAYLKLEGVKVNTLQEMLSLKRTLKEVNPLALKPCYMKDSYAKPIY